MLFRSVSQSRYAGREKGIQALMTVNLLKRLESSVHSFRLTLKSLQENHHRTLEKIAAFRKTGRDSTFVDVSPAFADTEPEEEGDFPEPDDSRIGNKVEIKLSDMDLPRWEHDLLENLNPRKASMRYSGGPRPLSMPGPSFLLNRERRARFSMP